MKPNKKNIDNWFEAKRQHRSTRTHRELLKGIKTASHNALAQAITLIESTNSDDLEQAHELMGALTGPKIPAKRIGITGIPGVGKSTLIENFGLQLIEAGHKVAVLAIDPSSTLSGGSILGDKTRMEQLSQNPNAFIRPTAAGQTLGGVAKNTRQAIALCEAAGFDIILIETVGVGQSETLVHGMVDFFILLMLAGAGDQLQGIKRGIMELADLIVINKADGENENLAMMARKEYASAIHLFASRTDKWQPKVECASGLLGSGLDKIWQITESYFNHATLNGSLVNRRQDQELALFNQLLIDLLQSEFYSNQSNLIIFESLKQAIAEGKMMAYEALTKLKIERK